MAVITCIEDLRQIYKRRVPRMFYDYTESGSYTEGSFHDNSAAFGDIRLRQRVAVDMSNRSLATTMIGEDVVMPVALAPVGMTGMQCADGEIKAARAAEAFGVPFTLSTMSICSIEDLAAATGKPFWFQLYVMQDQQYLENIIERARVAGCSALVLTLDLQILGQRHKDLKNGLSAPPRLTLPNIINMATKWRWGAGMLGTRRRFFGNIVGHVKGVDDPGSLMKWTDEQFDPRLDWDKIARIRDQWGGKLILKGILDEDDARMAMDSGADAIIVSNHGGRQLDGALPTIRMLPRIRRAVGDSYEVFLDSGIRSGQDVVKALALGADSTFIGRAFIYGLGAMGQAGVTRALEVIRDEMDVTMALMGERDIRNISRRNVLLRRGWEDEYQHGD